uniref:Galectin n=1 Tax=Astyanax mexicanus TaxID=7994 RepID=W5KKK0_ASTMX
MLVIYTSLESLFFKFSHNYLNTVGKVIWLFFFVVCRFEINLKTGQSAGDDIAFHFKPQIGQKVSLNSFKKGAWENEESVSDKPFAKGGAFTIIFVIKVYVNGFQHCTFKHRMSVERVSAIDIRGDVNINMFGFIQASVFSSLDKFSVAKFD